MVIATLTHSVLEVLHVATTIAEEIFRHLEVSGHLQLIVALVSYIFYRYDCFVTPFFELYYFRDCSYF